MNIQRLLIFAQHVQGVGFRAEAATQSLFIFQAARDDDVGFRKKKRFAGVFAQFAAHYFIQLLDDVVFQQPRMGGYEFGSAGICREICELAQQLLRQRRCFVLLASRESRFQQAFAQFFQAALADEADRADRDSQR